MKNIGISLAAAGYAATWSAWWHESDNVTANRLSDAMCDHEQTRDGDRCHDVLFGNGSAPVMAPDGTVHFPCDVPA